MDKERTGADFYKGGESAASAEAERLRLMAEFADVVSLEVIGDEALQKPGIRVLDVGAGDSTSLENIIRGVNDTASCYPSDKRHAAAQAHQAEEFSAVTSLATALPYRDNSADIVHARFTLGWLNKQGREQAIEQMLRVGKEKESTLAIIDYDWTTVRGPIVYMKLVDKAMGIIRAAGFEPEYGAHMHEQVQQTLTDRGLTPETGVTVQEKRVPMEVGYADSLDLIDAHVQPLIERLHEQGLPELAGELSDLRAEMEDRVEELADETVAFPDFVGVRVDIANPEKHRAAVVDIEQRRRLAQSAMEGEVAIPIGPEELGTSKLTSPNAIHQARILQAEAYRNHGHVTEEGIREDGTLVEEIDPEELVSRSTYIGAVNNEGVVTGCIRLINPLDGDPNTLPTVQKLVDQLGANNLALRSLPFMRDPSKRVYEASALGRSTQSGDWHITSKLVLGIVCEAKRAGYDYAVMGVVENVAKMLVATFGDQAFKRIDGEEAVITLEGEGINPDGVRLVPFYADMSTFLGEAMDHFVAAGLAKRPSAAKNAELCGRALAFTQAYDEVPPDAVPPMISGQQ